MHNDSFKITDYYYTIEQTSLPFLRRNNYSLWAEDVTVEKMI